VGLPPAGRPAAHADRRPLYIALAGFLVLIVASSGLETLRFYTLKIPLPLGPGGIIGIELAAFAVRNLGYTGATLALLGGCWRSAGASSPGCRGSAALNGIGALFERVRAGVYGLFDAGRTAASAAKSPASAKRGRRGREESASKRTSRSSSKGAGAN
jgi:hypothetical protein